MSNLSDDRSRIGIVGAAAAHLLSGGWRGLAQQVRQGAHAAGGSGTAPRARGTAEPPWTRDDVPVVAVEAGREVQDRRALRLMAQPTRLAAIVMRDALLEAQWRGDRSAVGYCCAVGAGSGPMTELGAILAQSLDSGQLSLERFATGGLGATNPLFAFQLLNNYVHCHPAILEGLGGGALGWFSRGAGTARAIEEATWALREGECQRVVAGGADSAWAAGTWLELRRRGILEAGFVPGEAAAAIALIATERASLGLERGVQVASGSPTAGSLAPASAEAPVIGWLDAVRVDDAPEPRACDVRNGHLPLSGPPDAGARLDTLTAGLALESVDVVVMAPWGPAARSKLGAWARTRARSEVLDLTATLGDALAATPALAVTVALDAVAGSSRSALAVGVDVDNALWALLVRGEL